MTVGNQIIITVDFNDDVLATTIKGFSEIKHGCNP
jgi:hypothetical protein